MLSAASSTVLWLPSHPSMGAASMDRYWRELERERIEQSVPEGWQIISPLGTAPEESHRAGRLARAWHKYVGYPLAAGHAARRRDTRVVHVLDHSFAHLLAGVPDQIFKVATVHDLAPLRDGTDLTTAQQARFRRTVENLRRADLVLADSHHSANEALELLSLDPARLRVLPLGVRFKRFTPPEHAEIPPWRVQWSGKMVILSVGVTIGRKNLSILPAVFHQLRANNPRQEVALLRVGQMLPAELRAQLHKVLGDGNLRELGLVPEMDLVAAYQFADALLFPSLLEGFGFPVLEAMAAGCPVVCTDVTSLPEVGGPAALYFKPDDPNAAAAQLQRLFDDPQFRHGQRASGFAQVSRFSWGEHYRQLVDLYKSGL